MFNEVQYKGAKTWGQPKCPLSEEWIKKRWSIHTMEYHTATKRNEIMPLTATSMVLEIIILVKSDRERQISQDISHMWNLSFF